MLSELFRIMVEENGSFNDCEGWKSILCTTVMVSILTRGLRLPFEAAFRRLSELFRIRVRVRAEKMAFSTTVRAGNTIGKHLLYDCNGEHTHSVVLTANQGCLPNAFRAFQIRVTMTPEKMARATTVSVLNKNNKNSLPWQCSKWLCMRLWGPFNLLSGCFPSFPKYHFRKQVKTIIFDGYQGWKQKKTSIRGIGVISGAFRSQWECNLKLLSENFPSFPKIHSQEMCHKCQLIHRKQRFLVQNATKRWNAMPKIRMN